MHPWNRNARPAARREAAAFGHLLDTAGIRENVLEAGAKVQPMINSVALQRTEKDDAQWENVVRQYEGALRTREPKKILAVEPAN